MLLKKFITAQIIAITRHNSEPNVTNIAKYNIIIALITIVLIILIRSLVFKLYPLETFIPNKMPVKKIENTIKQVPIIENVVISTFILTSYLIIYIPSFSIKSTNCLHSQKYGSLFAFL